MAAQVTPEVLWAQRSSSTDSAKNYIYLTICTPDVSPSSLKLDLTPNSLSFTGYSDTKKTSYHVDLEFYGEIDVENSKTNHTPRDVELILRKKELSQEYWPRLLKNKQKVHFLKTDFDKWVDEDEQDNVTEDADYMNNFGGGGMGGMGGDGDFGGIDFSKLGGGMGGMGGMDDMGIGGDDEDEEDEEMPGLEEEGAKGGEETHEGHFHEGHSHEDHSHATTSETSLSTTNTAEPGAKIEEVS